MSERYSVEEIAVLMEAMQKYKLGSVKVKSGDCSVTLHAREIQAAPAGAPVAMAAAAYQAPPSEEPVVPEGKMVKSPIVGTFYAAPAPDQEPFIKPGQQVKKGDVLFIIESMKLMNEVLCEEGGTVAEILVENAQAVEYGQPILRME